MKVLISEKLSEHKYKTPEGYLICTDAILARTGKQSYTKDELFCDGDNTEVNVDRPYDEVMNAKTIASFENKPITFDHPDEDVNVGNYKDYAIGYVRDVHQGKTNKGEDVILGNLVITDQDAINAIEQGDHTDLSCGYDCDIRDDGNGNYSQTNIRGNHLALCEQGRAGIAHIVDSKARDSKIEKVPPELLLNLNDWFSDKLYIERKYHVKIYNIISNEGLTVTGSRQDLEKLYKDYHLENGYHLKIVDSKVEDEMNYSEEMKAVRNALRHIVVDNKSEMKQLIQDLIDNKPMNYSLEVRRLKRAIDELIKWSDNRQEGIDTIWAIAKENRIVDSKVKDAAIGGHYKNNSGENFFICSYGSGFSIFKADGEYLDGSKHLSLDGVKQRILYYNLTKVKDSVVDSKARDLVNDSEELVVGRWYDFAKKIKVTKNEYAKSLRITGKSGNVYSYTIYLKNGELYDRGTYSEIKERFNIKDSVEDSKVEDNYMGVLPKERRYRYRGWVIVDYGYSSAPYSIEDYPYANEFRTLEEAKAFIRRELSDSKKVEDAGWKTTKMASGIIHELGNMRIIEEENEKGDIQYRIGGTNGQVFSSLEKAKNAIRQKNLDEIKKAAMKLLKQKPFLTYEEALQKVKENIRNGYYLLDNDEIDDSKEMTMSDAIKMLNIVDIYKKVKDSYIVVRNKSKYEDAARKLGLTIEKDSKSLRIYGDKYKLKQLQNQFDNDEEISYVVIKDASKNEWVIKNTGLAYEIWNQGKMVKKFPTKKLAIEWIHSRFPTDKITEDSTKDGRLWQTLTRKAKH